VPDNVLQSAATLRRELRPERGPIDWRPIIERRRRAEKRILAVSEYASVAGCRRSRLVGYFGETLSHCSGCDRCGVRPKLPKLDREVATRITRLRRSLLRSKTVWGGCPLEPEVLLSLARRPPADAAALADVPGVGPALAERLGGTILAALGPPEREAPAASSQPTCSALEAWRARVAADLGVPRYAVLTDSALRTIATERPQSREELARIPGVGPRILAKFGDAVIHQIIERQVVVTTSHSSRTACEMLDELG